MLKFQINDTTIIATFEDFILTTYVIIDELYHRFAPSEVRKRRHHLNNYLKAYHKVTEPDAPLIYTMIKGHKDRMSFGNVERIIKKYADQIRSKVTAK